MTMDANEFAAQLKRQVPFPPVCPWRKAIFYYNGFFPSFPSSSSCRALFPLAVLSSHSLLVWWSVFVFFSIPSLMHYEGTMQEERWDERLAAKFQQQELHQSLHSAIGIGRSGDGGGGEGSTLAQSTRIHSVDENFLGHAADFGVGAGASGPDAFQSSLY